MKPILRCWIACRPLGLTADDLRRIGFPAAAQPSAALALLGVNVPDIERALSEKWRKDNLGPWHDRHRRAGSEARRQAAAAATATPEVTPSADIPALWETACEAVNLHGPAAAAPLLKRVLDRDPNHDGAAVILGRHLALAGDPEGEAMLARVIARNDEAWMPRPAKPSRRSFAPAVGSTHSARFVDGSTSTSSTSAPPSASARRSPRPTRSFP